MVELRLDPAFVEEVVFLELKQRAASGEVKPAQVFHQERAALYELRDVREREAAFQRVANRYFQSLGLRGLFADRFEEFPRLSAQLAVAVVRRVWSRKEERVELYVGQVSDERPEPKPSATLLIGLQANRCLHRQYVVAFLRHELMHVSDMLDPAFAYDSRPQLGGECEAEDDLVRERFRLLWDLWVLGRMQRMGWQPSVDESTRCREFERAFASLNPRHREAVFQTVLSRDHWTQQELLTFARDERLTQPLGLGGVRCPLCHFPTREGVWDWRGERAAVAEAIHADYAWWDPTQGACRQCFELYRARFPVMG